MIVRGKHLNKFEMLEYFESMNCLVEFDLATFVEPKKLQKCLKDSFILCKCKYPYLRMKFSANGQAIVEQNSQEFDLVNLECVELAHKNALSEEKTQERFNHFGSLPANLQQTVFHAKLYSFQQKNFQLLISINHACCDGIGACAVFKDLFSFLDKLLSGIDAKQVQVKSKKFFDPFKSADYSSIDLNQIASESSQLNKYQNYVKNLSLSVEKPLSEFSRFCLSFRLTEHETQHLCLKCKINKTTVQGVLSVAVMLSLINESRSLDETSFRVLNGSAINMRYSLDQEASSEDLMLAVSMLYWYGEFDHGDNLWSIARQGSKKVHEMKKNREGLKFWKKLNSGLETDYEETVVNQSSIGKISFQEDKIKNVKFKNLNFFNTTYNNQFDQNFIAVFAYTFLNRFTITFSHTCSRLSYDWSHNFTKNIEIVLKFMSNEILDDRLTVEYLLGKLIKN
ncbi:alcohol acetyltransferase [Brachionus plicatilis]|uniref:Alcohol acetyltransferase n=1 Tax=Brachionus plicatilis TaxID=10195 RepID=A0A3M7S3J8_BRAPC|nr:alcohol acetyltransferase [Brachionus plicatilis]